MKYIFVVSESHYFIVSVRMPHKSTIIVIAITVAMITDSYMNFDTFFLINLSNKQISKQTNKQKNTSKAEQRIALNNREHYLQWQNLHAFYEKCCFFRLTLKLPKFFQNFSSLQIPQL